ncbi:MAG: hypothetical protein Harvfovirus82_2 [Harvfovirus sp.]|uniref:Serine hydrolase domain-containing protein n=1 Tax=Harvfovirus sp. TaxID=2487768 RepID=A0A3G5A3Z4_9VIRU|nr:MAG: hypothetical protein Harvfovirus82_2 [Harvfovirus sp.]
MKRILCFGGFTQTDKMMENTLRGLKSQYKKEFIFDILPGPYVLPDGISRAWYVYSKEKPLEVDWAALNSQKEKKDLISLDDSFTYAMKALEGATYSIILGFSQGAAFLSLLAMHTDLSQYKLIFVGGFLPIKITTYKPKFKYKTMHIMGKADDIIKEAWSNVLASCFEDPILLTHKYRHIIPRIPKTLINTLLT